ncbi:hypothetical protein [Thiohalorhabdus sp.]|uniref:hypothetical protein n=1 Tax=Thiohalorhabdus sp. TaxID=3094134 RepID=UPI002FC2D74C
MAYETIGRAGETAEHLAAALAEQPAGRRLDQATVQKIIRSHLLNEYGLALPSAPDTAQRLANVAAETWVKFGRLYDANDRNTEEET